jgi:DNA-binding transcriptional regulator LsrR (DeoR family)
VAKQLGMAPSTVTRRKEKALRCRILRVSYHPPRKQELESDLLTVLKPYKVREIVVCARDVGVAAARYYSSLVEDGHTLVLDGGITVSSFVSALGSATLPLSLRVIPLCADPPSYVVSAYECMTRLATFFPGAVMCEKLPHILSPELDNDHRRIRRLADKADAVVLGCGPWKRGFTANKFFRNLGIPPGRIRADYPRITCVCGYCALDDQGNHVPWPAGIGKLLPRSLDFEGIVSLSASDGARVILLAETAKKGPAVYHSIKAGMANVLIADEGLAVSLLKIARRAARSIN